MSAASGGDPPPKSSSSAHLTVVSASSQHNDGGGSGDSNGGDGKPKKPPKEADACVRTALELTTLLHDDRGDGYAVIGERDVYLIRSRPFRLWLAAKFFSVHGKSPSSAAINQALQTLEGRALHDAPLERVHLRVAKGGEQIIYYDLGDPERRIIRVTSAGWEVLNANNAPIRFYRPPSMSALPIPEPGGSIDLLRPFVSLRSEDDFALLLAWLVSALRPRGPYPILLLSGGQGAGKSMLARIAGRLVDPNAAPLRSPPRSDRDLAISASNAHVLAFDNVGTLDPAMSDALCRVATGGGLALRALRTDRDEVIFDLLRPIVLNGIGDMATRPDLQDRSLLVRPAPIAEGARRTEKSMWEAFDGVAGKIFGALLDAVSCALRDEPTMALGSLPRLADAMRWATAAEPALGLPRGRILEAYARASHETTVIALEADVVTEPLLALLRAARGADGVGRWSGTATELLRALRAGVEHARHWPDTPNALTGRLRRLSVPLRAVGVLIDEKRYARQRLLLLEYCEPTRE